MTYGAFNPAPAGYENPFTASIKKAAPMKPGKPAPKCKKCGKAKCDCASERGKKKGC